MLKKIKIILDSIQIAFHSPYFGFVEGHAHLNGGSLNKIKCLVGESSSDVVSDFERQFSNLIGHGQAVSYAAARMGFYDLMHVLGLTKGDEVILLGATCSVMSTAVIRIGAIPIYADIDPDTLGSSCKAIEACISKKTRMIVAQHSFGIPCDITPIVEIANDKNIFLLEDCALTLGSKRNGIVAGNFGDAALFSSDHSKPINTMIGGIIYTKDKKLESLLRKSRDLCKELPVKKQYALWFRFLIERRLCNSRHYGKMQLVDILYSVGKKFFRITDPFLVDDYKLDQDIEKNPYPAKIPTFLAQLGIYEIIRWQSNLTSQKKISHSLIEELNKTNIQKYLPKAYNNSSLNIIPFRIAWSEPKGQERRDNFSSFIRVDWTWFMAPIISTKDSIEELGYIYGSCPNSEKITRGMVNLPTNLLLKEKYGLLTKLNLLLN